MEAIVRHHEIVTELFLRMKSYGQKKMETFCGHWEMSWKNYLRKQWQFVRNLRQQQMKGQCSQVASKFGSPWSWKFCQTALPVSPRSGSTEEPAPLGMSCHFFWVSSEHSMQKPGCKARSIARKLSRCGWVSFRLKAFHSDVLQATKLSCKLSHFQQKVRHGCFQTHPFATGKGNFMVACKHCFLKHGVW